jgi:hypothetical protein
LGNGMKGELQPIQLSHYCKRSRFRCLTGPLDFRPWFSPISSHICLVALRPSALQVRHPGFEQITAHFHTSPFRPTGLHSGPSVHQSSLSSPSTDSPGSIRHRTNHHGGLELVHRHNPQSVRN